MHSVGRGGRWRPVLRPAPDRLGARVAHVDEWQSVLRDSILELDVVPVVDSAERRDYAGWVYALDAGPVSVTDVGSHPVRVARTPRLIDRNPRDIYHLSVAQRPSWSMVDGQRRRLRAGDAVLFDTTDPWAIGTADSFGHFLVIDVPRPALRRDLRGGPANLGQIIPAENASLRVLMRVVADLARNASALTPESRFELGHTAYELLLSTLRLEMNGQRSPADPRTPRGVLLLRMREFVLDNLHDPDLSPGLLARVFHVSPRFVDLAFHEAGLSPSRFIRDARMAAARRILADPRQRHRSIASIGRAVGIENPSVFARAFRKQYEVTPREYRYEYDRSGDLPASADAV